jgi:hypothetical protein
MLNTDPALLSRLKSARHELAAAVRQCRETRREAQQLRMTAAKVTAARQSRRRPIQADADSAMFDDS